MATKTISLELDAYEKLRAAKKPGESFSAVVRRVEFPNSPLTGEKYLAYLRNGGSGVSEEYLDSVEEAIKYDPPPDDPWA
jgi:putative antitoxin of VapBC-like toxin-antitoxin system